MPAVDIDPSPDSKNLLQYIKQKSSTNAVRKIIVALEEAENGVGSWGEDGIHPDSSVYRTAVRALLKANRTDLAIQVYRQRMNARAVRPTSIGTDFPLAASVLKAVLRDCKKRGQKDLHVSDILEDVMRDCDAIESNQLPAAEIGSIDRVVPALISMSTALLNEEKLDIAKRIVQATDRVAHSSNHAHVPVRDFNNLIRMLGKKKMIDQVFEVLALIRKTGGAPNNETFEFLANATVKQVDFVTGAVSMSTLPEPLAAEVAFAGRSNVGKSSLVNMLCNRKALAYVSGRPGKTQQFNYFLVNGKDLESQFYIVDMPGVGYAKVPKPLQKAWMKFMEQYFMYRTSLRLIFHLVDGRHGALADDEALMTQIAATGRERDYVVVLTKMDKMDKQKVKQSILDRTRSALIRNGCPSDTPILLTSANSKLGREELWRELRSALHHLAARRSH